LKKNKIDQLLILEICQTLKVLLIITLTFNFSTCSLDQKKAHEHLKKANEYFKKNNYGDASNEIAIALKLDSTDYETYILMAKIKSKTDQNKEAVKILMSLLNKKYKEDTINFLIGECYSGLAHYYVDKKWDKSKADSAFENAISYYNLSIKNNIKYYDAYVRKCAALHNQEKYDESLITINNALLLFPDSMNLTVSRGIEKNCLGDNVGANNDLNEAIQSNKLDSQEMAKAYRFLGIIYEQRDSLDKAIIVLSIALKFNPKDYYAYENRAFVYLKKGLKTQACKDLRKAADLGLVSSYIYIKKYCDH
jgi:tetratricopeptide (TPR) repeat protein